MKKSILCIALCITSIVLFGQENEEQHILIADSTWGKEIIHLPFGFAPDINYEGYEDIRFAPGWGKEGNPDFWSYIFVWNINLKNEPTTKFIEEHLKLYFDGLMTAVNKEKDKTIPKTSVVIIKEKAVHGIPRFSGTVNTHDSFRTRKMMTLNVLVDSYYCEKTKTYMPLFKFSPKDFEHDIWTQLNSIILPVDSCMN